MRLLVIILLLFSGVSFAQIKQQRPKIERNVPNGSERAVLNRSTDRFSARDRMSQDSLKVDKIITAAGDTVAPISEYKIFNEYRGASAFDTVLNIQKQYHQNYLRKDLFGVLGFSNDGQTYQALDPNFLQIRNIINMGFNARRFSYLNNEDINYYRVPTPATELFYRSVTGKGQNLDALITINTSEQFNVFVGYRGMRSQGKYVNQLTSNGNFRIGSSYFSKSKRYQLKNHITVQDIYNDESGGLFDTRQFDASEEPYDNRQQIRVQSDDSKTVFKGLRTYVDHSFQFNKSEQNKALIRHQFTYEYFSNVFQQGNYNPFNFTDPATAYFGTAFSTRINDKVKYKRFENEFDLAFDSSKIGLFSVTAGIYNLNYQYSSIIFDADQGRIPNFLKDDIITLGGSYFLNKENYTADMDFKQSVVGRALTDLKINAAFRLNEKYGLQGSFRLESKIPDYTYQLFQSDFTHFNWYNDFSNEKHSTLNAVLNTPWIQLSGTYQLIADKLYFSNDVNDTDANGRPKQLLVSPKQYDKVINYFSIKAAKEFRYRKWSLDNTIMFQQVAQEDAILNVPQIITRNTLYYSDHVFNKALYFQTGIVFNYFTKYYANEYHPVIGDFIVQDQIKIGNFPMFDFFLNAKVKTAQFYINIEHFNSTLTGYRFYNTPTYPYRDLTFRIGVKWNFFN
ncbi:MAG TPA: putative porin [Flavobacterium sp.]|nr:putative porin [Flavobacterium sp.]